MKRNWILSLIILIYFGSFHLPGRLIADPGESLTIGSGGAPDDSVATPSNSDDPNSGASWSGTIPAGEHIQSMGNGENGNNVIQLAYDSDDSDDDDDDSDNLPLDSFDPDPTTTYFNSPYIINCCGSLSINICLGCPPAKKGYSIPIDPGPGVPGLLDNGPPYSAYGGANGGNPPGYSGSPGSNGSGGLQGQYSYLQGQVSNLSAEIIQVTNEGYSATENYASYSSGCLGGSASACAQENYWYKQEVYYANLDLTYLNQLASLAPQLESLQAQLPVQQSQNSVPNCCGATPAVVPPAALDPSLFQSIYGLDSNHTPDDYAANQPGYVSMPLIGSGGSTAPTDLNVPNLQTQKPQDYVDRGGSTAPSDLNVPNLQTQKPQDYVGTGGSSAPTGPSQLAWFSTWDNLTSNYRTGKTESDELNSWATVAVNNLGERQSSLPSKDSIQQHASTTPSLLKPDPSLKPNNIPKSLRADPVASYDLDRLAYIRQAEVQLNQRLDKQAQFIAKFALASSEAYK